MKIEFQTNASATFARISDKDVELSMIVSEATPEALFNESTALRARAADLMHRARIVELAAATLECTRPAGWVDGGESVEQIRADQAAFAARSEGQS